MCFRFLREGNTNFKIMKSISINELTSADKITFLGKEYDFKLAEKGAMESIMVELSNGFCININTINYLNGKNVCYKNGKFLSVGK